ncbi:MAG: PKD domain-containing protein, partial [Bacteroidota bacterium]
PTTSVAGDYQVALRLTSSVGGCSATYVENVQVLPLPDAEVVLSSTVSCIGEPITISNPSFEADSSANYRVTILHAPSGDEQAFLLNNGDTTLTLSHSDDSLRTYEITLEATALSGCQTVSNPIVVAIPPTEQTDFADPNYSFLTANCSPWSSTFLVDESTQAKNPDSYTWILLDTAGDTVDGYPVTKLRGDTAFHELAYSLTNSSSMIESYRMVLSASKANACLANDTFDIQISPQPQALFTVERDEDCDEVRFTIEASQKGLDYQWVFDPEPVLLTADDEFRFALYERPGINEQELSVAVSLTTSNLANCSSEPYEEDLSIANQNFDIIALFDLSSDTLQLPDATVDLTNRSTLGAAYRWDFGDGDTSDNYTPGPHTYQETGQFMLTLTVDNGICQEDYARIVTVLPQDPVIDFEATPVNGCSPLIVKFQNTSVAAASGKFLWEFGDGSISTLDEPTHTYTQGGTYTVRLRGENENGVVIEREKTDYIEVLSSPFADFLATPRVVYIPDQEVFFRNLSTNASSFIWDFGDGQRSEAYEPRHAYTEEGFYDITLIATNDSNCVDTLYRPTEVQAIRGGSVQAPNAFTPSLSGPSGGELGFMGNSNPSRLNDVFLPKLEGVSKFRMSVYNKWGQLLFLSDSQTRGWDGYYRGQLSPSGVYVYKLELTYSDGREEVKAGDLTLIR